MRSLRQFAVLLAVLAGFATAVPTAPIFAQDSTEIPPLPRPRPDRDATAEPAASNADGTATDAIAAVTSVPQPVTLTARITQDGTPIPEGVVWRVFESTPDANGEMALVAKAESGSASLELPPGDYVVHVAYGQAQVSETLSVVPGENTHNVVLDAGALRLNSAVSGDIPISPALLHFDIYTSGAEETRALIADNLPPNEIVTLNAGTYHIVSRFGAINAVVRADLRVEPGQLTDATLYHHAAEVSFKLVSEEGGEAIADVEWTVKTGDGATIFSERGAFPSTVLSEGEYLVLAKLGDQVYNREVEVQPGGPREIEVLTTVYQ
ncbi:hypothetical protein SAMN06295905_1380 [Devosia lucknowensis]|uniref:Carboxypeptidase regulatory-like domain-containing protein n=1 Tax=Devosia lucknowensis TaxID=1096929 RepID=A0A1Y6EXQ2_9HYPH|nr:hypothetical protein [Devosia lucknowensis]SMQ66041.1 hypothetical protein SAMN06295905_1380 [Devosia lucknowensis]